MSSRCWRLLAPLLLLLPLAAAAGPAEDLVAKNRIARGGDALAAVQTLRMGGRMTFPGGFELEFRELKSRQHGVRIDSTIQGLTIVQAFDGADAWQIQPFEGRKDAARMSADEARAIADEGLVDGFLLASVGRSGTTLVDLGTEDVDGTLARKLRVVQADGDEFTYFIDPDSWLEIKIVEKRRLRDAESVVEYELGDYEQVAGAWFPMSIESGPPGSTQRQKINLDVVEVNVALDAGLFRMPAVR
jgi:hypothetical protein